jgi:hypothetical protein
MCDKSLRKLALDQKIPYIKLPGMHTPYLFDVRDLDRWIEQEKKAS